MTYTREELISALRKADAAEDTTAVNELVGMLDTLPDRPSYTSTIVSEAGTPAGGENAGGQLAAWLGFGPNAETKPVQMPDGSVHELTRGAEMSKAFTMAQQDYKQWGQFAESLYPTGAYVDANGNDMLTNDLWDVEQAGGHYASAEERYGSEFMAMGAGSEERNAVLKQRTADGLDREGEHALTQAAQEVAGVDPTADFIGYLAKKAWSPSSLAPVGGTIKRAMISGGLLLGETEAAEQLAGEKERDLGGVAKATALGAVAGPILAKPIQTARAAFSLPYNTVKKAKDVADKAVKRMVNRSSARKVNKGSVLAANNISRKLQAEMDEQIVKGVNPNDVYATAQEALQLTDQQAMDALITATVKPEINSQKQAILNVTRKANPLESTTAIGKGIDALTSSITYTIEKIHKPLVVALRQQDMNASINTARSRDKLKNLLDGLKKVSKEDPARKQLLLELERVAMSGQTKVVKRIAEEHFPDIAAELVGTLKGKAPIRALLDDIHDRARAAGIKVAYIAGFIPRSVKNLKGLREAIGVKYKTTIDEALAKRALKDGVEVDALDDDTVASIINDVFLNKTSGLGKKKTEASRTIDEIHPSLQEFYDDMGTSLVKYTDRMERQIAKNNFFGVNKSAVLDAKGNVVLDKSIGRVLSKEVVAGNLSPDQVGQLRALLVSRFDMGEQAMQGGFAKLRDLQTMMLLAQFKSAGTQLSDLGMSMTVNGFANTIKAMGIRGKNAKVTVEDFGLLNKAAAEYEQGGGFSTMARTLMKTVGFTQIDMFGKNVFLKSSLLRAEKLATKDPAKFRAKYGSTYGEGIGRLIKDLQEGVVSEDVRLHLWSELAEIQPIALSELPQIYLNHPNGRLFFSMKTFSLKQMNFVRKNIVDEFRVGNTEEALMMGMRYVMFMGTLGLSVVEAKNFLFSGFDEEALGVDTSSSSKLFNSLPIEFGETMLKTLFLGRYDREKHLEQGNLAEWVLAQGSPAAANIVDTFGAAFMSTVKGEGIDSKPLQKLGAKVPVVGDVWNTFFNGGAEKMVEDNRKERELKDKRVKNKRP
jgi:hypothetical protein